jgi:hypothetical protein
MLKRTGLATLVVFLAIAGTAWATSTSGHQNPDLLVTASVLPTHAQTGDVIKAVATVTNTTDHRIRVGAEFEFDKPTSGVGGAADSILGPGQSLEFHFHAAVKANSVKGDYLLIVRATAKHGTSHARAHASSS